MGIGRQMTARPGRSAGLPAAPRHGRMLAAVMKPFLPLIHCLFAAAAAGAPALAARLSKYARTLAHLLLYFMGKQPAHTHTTDAERAVLARHASGRRRLAEIGVYEGLTTALLAACMAPDGVIFGVDPYVPGRFGVSWCRLIAHRQIARQPRRAQIVLCEVFSHQAAARLPGMFDFIFIDGDHSIAAIELDWESWSGRILPGGIVGLHDSRVPAHDPAVARFGSVAYFEAHIAHDERFELVEQVDSLSILRRK